MGRFQEESAPPLVELSTVQDVFCTGIARIENLGGGCFRFVLFVDQQDTDGRPERVVVERLIIHRENVPRAVRQMLTIAGTPFITEVYGLAS